jgi:hypothetical protein
MEMVVSQAHVEVWVGRGGLNPSPVPLVSMGMCVVPGGENHMMVVEMTPSQVRQLIHVLQRSSLPATPEGA